MQYVELLPGIRSSVIGFGCAPILGSVDASTARKAIATALDEGITHFDLARSYGYGDAEKFVGSFLRGRRDQLVLASKFGIVATPAARLLRPLKPIVRALRSKSIRGTSGDGTRRPGAAKAAGQMFHRRISLDSASMRRSVEKSLKALGTDYLDYLLLHEPPDLVASIDELAACAKEFKNAGKIRGWGIATTHPDLPKHIPHLDRFDVLQADAESFLDVDQRTAGAVSRMPAIMFSPFRVRLERGESVSPPEILRDIVRRRPHSVVLCSMFTEAHIRANARSVG
jgi:aryl-alcohol dehydrogenase-like predicted oxidoreductase